MADTRRRYRLAWAVLFSGASGPMSSENKVAVFAFDTGETRILADGNFPLYSSTGHVVFARGTRWSACGVLFHQGP